MTSPPDPWVIFKPSVGALRLDSRYRIWCTASFREAKNAAFHVDGLALRHSEWLAHEAEIRSGTWRPGERFSVAISHLDSGRVRAAIYELGIGATGATVEAALEGVRASLGARAGAELIVE